MIELQEVLLRQKEELRSLQYEAKTKYRTESSKILRMQKDSGPQQFEDKKALAFQIDTVKASLHYLELLEKTVEDVRGEEVVLMKTLLGDSNETK